LFLGLAYETHSTGAGGVPGGKDAETGIRLAASYTLGDLLLGVMYEMLNDMGGVADFDQKTTGLFASYKMGNNKLKFHWIDSPDLDCPSSLTCSGTSATMYAIGLDHVMSKTVTTYVNYAKVDNDQNAALGVVSAVGGHGEVVSVPFGSDPKGLSFGVILKF